MKVLQEIRLFLPFYSFHHRKTSKTHKIPRSKREKCDLFRNSKKRRKHQSLRFIYLDFGNTCVLCIDLYKETHKKKQTRNDTASIECVYRLRIERFYFR